MPVIDFDPRPVNYHKVTPEQISGFVLDLQNISQNCGGISMWETQLKVTYKNYDLSDPSSLQEKVSILYSNLAPVSLMEIPGTQGQSASEKWFSERWCRLTASKCQAAYKVEKLVVEAQPNAAAEGFKFISQNI